MPKVRIWSLTALVMVPIALVGVVLWYLAGLVPDCTNTVALSLPSPDKTHSLVVFSRNCGATTGANTQAAIVAAGAQLADDATGFLALDGTHDLQPAWNDNASIAMTLPPQVEPIRQDNPAGIAISYR
jgi:hypothetical protein